MNLRPISTLALASLTVLLAAGCGGSGSTTNPPPTSSLAEAATSVAQAATSAAEAATSAAADAGSSVADDARQRVESALPGVEAAIRGVEVNDADGTVTVQTTLGANDTLAGIVKTRCDAAKTALGDGTNRLVILADDGSTIASC